MCVNLPLHIHPQRKAPRRSQQAGALGVEGIVEVIGQEADFEVFGEAVGGADAGGEVACFFGAPLGELGHYEGFEYPIHVFHAAVVDAGQAEAEFIPLGFDVELGAVAVAVFEDVEIAGALGGVSLCQVGGGGVAGEIIGPGFEDRIQEGVAAYEAGGATEQLSLAAHTELQPADARIAYVEALEAGDEEVLEAKLQHVLVFAPEGRDVHKAIEPFAQAKALFDAQLARPARFAF